MDARTAPGVRLLPNAITILALCSGLSAIQFAMNKEYDAAILAIGVAAVLDGLDGRLARLLDATSKIGAELDSLCDGISFGVVPAIVLFIWGWDGERTGWLVALVFAVCMVLRLARFNTLLDDTEQPSFTKEFFVGVPAPAGAILALLPMVVTLGAGEGWWSSKTTLLVWTLLVAMLLISRIPTLSVKKLHLPAKAVAPVLVIIGIAGAALLTYPFLMLAVVVLLYLAHIPYAVYRYSWLSKHPEAWDVEPAERRAIRRRSTRRLGIRPPLRRRVAGAAIRLRRIPRRNGTNGPGPVARTSWRRLGLRRNRRD
ncbi:CDP-diacylglycerol--serine O-phosphatidyltransferase [Allokutzneria sp. A3M-2-11 16]|uniref:CDP-diacylglycerol--serine O-phosphatidyltransferase n=1 Tax=Allokutzneria sp. A3M-2-11 16 TaxID=2962043 RepID=UPI0020B87905|nr:CDP-diacylglycerol--serine O-phosphatidyltransferase [Allokutzneria sp. A3M-2-11 16]MCP3800055.1 CDP-diacylglycerol--serine O-phosphatidyltransferase [Allokutzneria sp. A3M-2-11 16]